MQTSVWSKTGKRNKSNQGQKGIAETVKIEISNDFRKKAKDYSKMYTLEMH
jgi:hypothetical protein